MNRRNFLALVPALAVKSEVEYCFGVGPLNLGGGNLVGAALHADPADHRHYPRFQDQADAFQRAAQTIDGVPIGNGPLLLVSHSNPRWNGIYFCRAGSWRRGC
jgi:hypothetical protein